MFLTIIIILFTVSFLLALKSLKSVNEKPQIKDVKKSLDKNKVIFQSQNHSSSE